MPISFEDAFALTSSDPTAYGLQPDAPEDEVKKRREQSASNIVAGVAANDTYWDSRPRLEALEARAQGHGVVVPPPTEDTPTAIEGNVTENTSGELPASNSDAEKLRAQLVSAGITPEV